MKTKTLLLVIVAIFSTTALSFAGCPGDETSGNKDQTDPGTLHGVSGPHTLKIYYDYPWNWPECYEETEDGYDAYDEVVQFGNRMERANCASTTDTAEVKKTASSSISATLSGSSTTTIGAQLGWPSVGTISLGTEGTLGWEVNATASGTFGIMTSDIPPCTKKWWYRYYYMAHRQGKEYDYVNGTAEKYCTTHSTWAGNYGTIIDYDGEINTATTEYKNAEGVESGGKSPCDATADPLQQSDIPKTFGNGPSWTSGEHWYDGGS